MCKIEDDAQEVANQCKALMLPSTTTMSYEHQRSIIRALANKDTESINSFVNTIKPLTDRLTANSIGWTITKLAEQNPYETTYLKHIGALR